MKVLGSNFGVDGSQCVLSGERLVFSNGRVLNGNAVISVETVSQENRANVGGFLAGGVLAGAAGAVVGGMSGRTANTCAIRLVGNQEMLCECATDEFQQLVKFARFGKREAPKDWSFLQQQEQTATPTVGRQPQTELEAVCPFCGGHMMIDPELRGMMLACPHCGIQIQSP